MNNTFERRVTPEDIDNPPISAGHVCRNQKQFFLSKHDPLAVWGAPHSVWLEQLVQVIHAPAVCNELCNHMYLTSHRADCAWIIHNLNTIWI